MMIQKGKIGVLEKKYIECGWYMNKCLRVSGGRYREEITEVVREKYYTEWLVGVLMCMEQWWNDSDRGTLNY